MRILVCGGRDFNDYRLVRDTLLRICGERGYLRDDMRLRGGVCIIHGGYRGADTCAGLFARRYATDLEVYKANWDKFGGAAGPIRNRQMLRDGKPDLVVAFPGNSGTADMVGIAKAAGVEVIEVMSPQGKAARPGGAEMAEREES